jgi:hypothetical protein
MPCRCCGCPGLPLEHVAPVGISSSKELENTGSGVEREKQQAPALVLSHVSVLVVPFLIQGVVGDAEHDVAEGDGDQPQSAAGTDEPLQAPAGDLHDALPDTSGRAERHRDPRQRESRQSGWRGPTVAKQNTGQPHGRSPF